MSKNNKAKVLAIAAAVIAAATGACQKKSPSSVGQGSPEAVSVVRPVKDKVEVWDEYTAHLEAYEFVEVRARVSGYLSKVLFVEGQEVKAGDLLFVIDPRPYQAALDSAKAAAKEVEARVELAKSNYNRAKELLAAKAISKEVYDTRNSELLSAEASLLNAKANLTEAELNLEFTDIRAPISGRVGEREIDPGNLVSANSSLLTTIVRSDIVRAKFQISERDVMNYNKNGLFSRIDILAQKGPPVQFILKGEDKDTFTGILNYYDNSIDRGTATLDMRADFFNKDGMLTPNMYGKVRILANESQEVIMVPEDLIGTDLVGRYVMVVNSDNVVETRPVSVGRLLGKYRIITDGVKEGDLLISKGMQKVMHGMKVVATEEKAED